MRDLTPRAPSMPVEIERVPTLSGVAACAVGLVLFLWFFAAFKLLLLGLLGAGALAAALRPVRDVLPGPRWGRAACAGLIPLVLLLTMLVTISTLVGQQIASDFASWPELRTDLDRLLRTWTFRLGFQEAPSITELLERGGQWLAGSAVSVIGRVGEIMSVVLLALGLLFFGAIFMLGQTTEAITQPIAARFSPEWAGRMTDAMSELEPKLRRWVVATGISMLTVTLVAWFGYSLVGLRAAGAVALLAGLAEIVPTIGPAVVFVLALLIAATQSPAVAIGVACVYVVLQLIESYVLLPYVMREALKMPPLVTLFSVIFWGHVFGLAGVLLAIPLNSALWVVAAHLVRSRSRLAHAPG